ncbi:MULTISPECIES: hypothetical protein [unclassified Thiocapsa]|uniref:hypothetical protein n=1 Tax=unclassified Thiocapsa TaxID=2641286 RepID=UPI0035AF070C
MLNGDLKKEALNQLQSAQSSYLRSFESVKTDSERLFILRQESSREVIGSVEKYINRLANTPKEFDRSFSTYKAEFKVFSGMIRQLESEAAAIDFKAGTSAATGVMAGVGVAAMGPTVAMAVATTFGAASTGTAISALSGAAATNAALAWIGGGALAAGGGGMAGGSAFLALAGPVGWAIGGTALLGSALFARSKNRKIAEETNGKRKIIEVHCASLKASGCEIVRLIEATKQHVNGVNSLLYQLSQTAPPDYQRFTSQQKEWLGALINHLQSLTALLNKKVDA